jgi:HNH endonuclease
MPKQRSWTDEQLKTAIAKSQSYRSVLIELGLIPAGGNYVQVKIRAQELGYSTDHFTGKLWNKGRTYHTKVRPDLETLLIEDIAIQSYKLKQRLYESGLKQAKCEICGWAEQSPDGRIPVELDHINGNNRDNRIENLRILCPNCHSLQPTHRGRNKKVRYARVVEWYTRDT